MFSKRHHGFRFFFEKESFFDYLNRCVNGMDQVIHDPSIRTKADCLSNPNLSWVNPNINFDNALRAMVALFQVVRYSFSILLFIQIWVHAI